MVGSNPFALSVACPSGEEQDDGVELTLGHAGDRAILAALVDNRLFFAGEATSPIFFHRPRRA
jgi:hypothetical protein